MKARVIGVLAAAVVGAAAHAQVQGPGLSLPLPPEAAAQRTHAWGLRGAMGGTTGAPVGWLDAQRGVLAADAAPLGSMLVADWYPLSSHGFRVSGGLANALLRDTTLARDAETERALRQWGSGGPAALDPWSWIARSNPYLGFGWELGAAAARTGLYMSADLGVVYQRGLANWGCTTAIPAGLCASDGRLDAAADDMRFAPMMSLGVGMRF